MLFSDNVIFLIAATHTVFEFHGKIVLYILFIKNFLLSQTFPVLYLAKRFIRHQSFRKFCKANFGVAIHVNSPYDGHLVLFVCYESMLSHIVLKILMVNIPISPVVNLTKSLLYIKSFVALQVHSHFVKLPRKSNFFV